MDTTTIYDPSPKNKVRGTTQILASGVCWALYSVLSKMAIEFGLTVVEINTVRMVLAAAIVGIYIITFRRVSLALPTGVIVSLLVLGALDYAIGGLVYIGSLHYIDAALSFLLVYSYPAMIYLASVAIGRERLKGSMLAAVVLTFVGVALVLEVGGAVEGEEWIGVWLVLASATVFSAYLMICERYLERYRSSQVSFFSLSGGAIGMLLIAPFYSFDFGLMLQPRSIVVLVVIAVIATALSMILFLMGVRHVGASRAAIITTIEPVMVVLLAWLFLGEVLSPMQLLGVALQMSGLMITQFKATATEPGP